MKPQVLTLAILTGVIVIGGAMSAAEARRGRGHDDWISGHRSHHHEASDHRSRAGRSDDCDNDYRGRGRHHAHDDEGYDDHRRGRGDDRRHH